MFKIILIVTVVLFLNMHFIYSSGGGEGGIVRHNTTTAQCLNVTHPHSGQDCYDMTGQDFTCCHLTVFNNNHTNSTQCIVIDRMWDFVPFFATEYEVSPGVYVNASATCQSTAEVTCSMDHPLLLRDCRYHGSSANSCCKITNKHGDTDCILSHEKFHPTDPSDHSYHTYNYTLWGNTIECTSSYLQDKIITMILVFLFITNLI